MNFSALLCAQSFPVQHWDTATVDQILIEGDRMYLNALEIQRISDIDSLSLIYLPNQARSTVESYAIFILLCTSHLFPPRHSGGICKQVMLIMSNSTTHHDRISLQNHHHPGLAERPCKRRDCLFLC